MTTPTDPRRSPFSSPWRVIAWGMVWCMLGLGVAVMLPVIEDAMGLSLVRYKRYRRYRRASRAKRTKATVLVKISSLSPAGRIDRGKLRLSIKQKLKRVESCYDLLTRNHKGKAPKRSKASKKTRKRARKRAKKKKLLGTAQVRLELNAYGRAIAAQLQKSSLPKRYHHCFVWFFRGRKFFPPEGNRSMKLRFALRIERRPPRAKGARKRRLRKAGGKW